MITREQTELALALVESYGASIMSRADMCRARASGSYESAEFVNRLTQRAALHTKEADALRALVHHVRTNGTIKG